MSNIVHRDSLLDQIARGLRALVDDAVGRRGQTLAIESLEVQLFVGEQCRLACDVPMALSYLANDIYWDEQFDWSDADRAEVSVY